MADGRFADAARFTPPKMESELKDLLGADLRDAYLRFHSSENGV